MLHIRKTKRQSFLALWQLITLIVAVFLFMINRSGGVLALLGGKPSTSTGSIVYLTLAIISIVAFAGLWIWGILNAFSIHKTSSRSEMVLIVFAFINLILGHLIVSFMVRSYAWHADEPVKVDKPQKSSELDKLNKALIDGVITSGEYEKKKKALTKND